MCDSCLFGLNSCIFLAIKFDAPLLSKCSQIPQSYSKSKSVNLFFFFKEVVI